MSTWCHTNSQGSVWLVDKDSLFVDDLIIRKAAGGWQVGISPTSGERPPPPLPPVYPTLEAAKVAYLILKGAGI